MQAVRALADDPTPTTIARVLDLLSLFDLLAAPFPFNAQTTFYRVWRAADRDQAERLAPVANRLGFE